MTFGDALGDSLMLHTPTSDDVVDYVSLPRCDWKQPIVQKKSRYYLPTGVNTPNRVSSIMAAYLKPAMSAYVDCFSFSSLDRAKAFLKNRLSYPAWMDKYLDEGNCHLYHNDHHHNLNQLLNQEWFLLSNETYDNSEPSKYQLLNTCSMPTRHRVDSEKSITKTIKGKKKIVKERYHYYEQIAKQNALEWRKRAANLIEEDGGIKKLSYYIAERRGYGYEFMGASLQLPDGLADTNEEINVDEFYKNQH